MLCDKCATQTNKIRHPNCPHLVFFRNKLFFIKLLLIYSVLKYRWFPVNFEKDGPIVFALALPAPNDYIDKHTDKHVFNHFYRLYCRCEVRASKSSQPPWDVAWDQRLYVPHCAYLFVLVVTTNYVLVARHNVCSSSCVVFECANVLNSMTTKRKQSCFIVNRQN